MRPRTNDRRRGQALVEFSIVFVPFVMLLFGVIDLGRGIYSMNGTSQAAREIARTTSVHLWNSCCDLGTSSEAQATIATQRGLIPGLQIDPGTDIVCIDATDTVKPDSDCHSGDYIRVTARATFRPMTPVVSSFGDHTFVSYSRVRIP